MGDSEVKPKTVLVVDDEPQIRKLLNLHLSEHGFQVVEKKNGREAWEHIEQNGCSRTDVVVTDVVMPEMDGVALATRVIQKCPNIKVVLMSGHTQTESLNLEAPDRRWKFVPKPFIPTVVLEAVQSLLE